MRIVLAPDSYKGCLTAREVAEAMAEGIRGVLPGAELLLSPMADGGEGTVHALLENLKGVWKPVEVTGPTGHSVTAGFGLLGNGKTAVLEMASASGLTLVPAGEQDPRHTSTYGTGQLILAALDAGARRICIGIGGSATNDAGAGMAQAIGYMLLDADGNELQPGGAALGRLAAINADAVDPRLRETEFITACDVTNPLLGPTGASAVYGPQKGATPEMIVELDRALARFAEVARETFGLAVADFPGAGAAGGLGAGLAAFCRARLIPGVEMVIEAVGLRDLCRGADLVMTGEGRIDGQTIHGKTPIGVAGAAKEFLLPVLAVAGSLGPGYEEVHNHGIDALICIAPGPITLAEAMASARPHIASATAEIFRAYLCGCRSV